MEHLNGENVRLEKQLALLEAQVPSKLSPIVANTALQGEVAS